MTHESTAVELEEEQAGKIVKITIVGKLEKEDYERFVPELERLIKQHGQIRVLVELAEFHGWSAAAAWEDIKFDVRHFSAIDRLAVVGNTRWQGGVAAFCRLFTRADVRYFDRAQQDEALHWIREGLLSSQSEHDDG